MPRALKVCSRPGCPNLTRSGRCPACEGEADRRRGTAAERGYTGRGHQAFRRAVLRRDLFCVLCGIQPSTHADHYPIDRRELVLRGENPNDPKHGRGLCASCDSKQTAQRQPTRWIPDN